MKEQYIRIDEDRNKYYYKDKAMTILHRLDGPAVEWANGSKSWWVDGKQHRLDGPAVEWANGYKAWYVDDKCHRLDGPAIEYADGYKAWYVDGKHLSEHEFNALGKPVEQYQKQINDLLSICQESINKNAKSTQALKALQEELEALQGEIKMTYEYYAGFGAKKDLTTTEMLNHILRTVPNYKTTDEEHDGWREAAYSLAEAIPASWEELQPPAEQLRKFKEMVALQNEKTKEFLDNADKHSKMYP